MNYVTLHFDTSLDVANQLAEDLQTYLFNNYKVDLQRSQTNESYMDGGSVLTIVLAAAPIGILAHGIKNWLSKKDGVSITVMDEHKKVIGTGMAGKDLPAFFNGIANLEKDAPRKR